MIALSMRGLFAAFLRTRRIARHYRRIPVPVAGPPAAGHPAAPQEMAQALQHAAAARPEALLEELGSHPQGLSEAAAARRRERSGANEIEQEKPLPWWLQLWHCYRTPFDMLLSLLAVISWLTEDVRATLVIGLMVGLSVGIRFWQERKSNGAADRLKAMVGATATVLRPQAQAPAALRGEPGPGTHQQVPGTHQQVPGACRVELPIRLLVPGDIVLLSAGDMVPADCRVLQARDLFMNQSALTGESLPVEKFPVPGGAGRTSLFELEDILFMGTNVVSGSATAVVVATGARSYFGELARHATAVERTPTQFQAGVNKVSWLLIRFMLVMVPLVLLINGFTKGDWLQAFLFALSVAVGLTPEMLPMIVTSTLAKGAVLLSRRKVIVKRLDAIQNFGAMDVLCTDKTGTLTQDRVFLQQHTDAWGAPSDEVLAHAYLNSHYQTGLKNLLDVAVLERAQATHGALADRFGLVDEIPFDFQRRRMSVVVAEGKAEGQGQGPHRLICKGAVEEVLQVCTSVRQDGRDQPLSPALLARIREVTGTLNGEGLRVVAVAVKELPAAAHDYRVPDEAGLTLVGYIAFLDPPKESAAPALQALARHGIAVKVLTGDNERVTARVCADVGLPVERVLSGSQIEAMDDAALRPLLASCHVFARLTPAHKERIVRLLRAEGHVVGYMGDGINDAPALHAADIGISVDTAVDIAREAADIILLEKSLLVLDEGVLEGRKTFANMLKYIKMTASSNFGNVLSVLVASAFLPFLPMLPMHLLVQNLLCDFAQTAIPFDNVDEALLRAPQRWQPEEISRFMLHFGPISSVFDVLTFLMMWFVFGASSVADQTLFQSGWFVVGLLTQTLIVHLIRTPDIPFVQSRPAAPLLFMTGLIMALGLYLPMGPFAHYFKLQPLPPLYFAYLPLILLGYVALTQAMKAYYRRRFGWH